MSMLDIMSNGCVMRWLVMGWLVLAMLAGINAQPYAKITALNLDPMSTDEVFNEYQLWMKYNAAYISMQKKDDGGLMLPDYVDGVPVHNPNNYRFTEKYFKAAFLSTNGLGGRPRINTLEKINSTCYGNFSQPWCTKYVHEINSYGVYYRWSSPPQTIDDYYMGIVVDDQNTTFQDVLLTNYKTSAMIMSGSAVSGVMKSGYGNFGLYTYTFFSTTKSMCFILSVAKNITFMLTDGLTDVFVDGSRVIYNSDGIGGTTSLSWKILQPGEHRLDVYHVTVGNGDGGFVLETNIAYLSEQCSVQKQHPCDAILFGSRFLDPSILAQKCERYPFPEDSPSGSSSHGYSPSSSSSHAYSPSSSISSTTSSHHSSHQSSSGSHPGVSSSSPVSSSSSVGRLVSSSSQNDYHVTSGSWSTSNNWSKILCWTMFGLYVWLIA